MTLLSRFRDSRTGRALIAALACALVGCSLSRPTPVKQTYLLQTLPPTAAKATPRPATLKVGTVQVAAPFRGKSLVYRESDLKYEADFYNEFFVAPTSMLTEGVGAWLAASGTFRDVLPAAANADGEFVLEGFVSDLYADYRDPGKPVAVLTARFFLLDNRTLTGVPIWQTELAQRIPMSTHSPDAFVAALNSAWAAMLTDLSRELAAAKIPPN